MSFDNLKQGDKVILRRSMQITSGGWRSGLSRDVFTEATVEKVTMTQFIADGLRFMRRDGAQYGARDVLAYLPGRPVGRGEGLAVPTPDAQINGWLLIRGALGDTQRRIMKLNSDSATVLKKLAIEAKTPEDCARVLEKVKAFNQALSDLLGDGSL